MRMSKSEWKTRTIENCLEILSFSKSRRLESSEYQAAGAYPIIDQGQNIIAGWTDDKNAVLFDPLPVIVFGDHTRTFKFVDFPFARGADGTQILKPRAEI